MLNTIDPELYSVITNVCKRPKNFDFSEISQPSMFVCLKSFHRFVVLVGRIEPIAYLVFYLVIKTWENLYKGGKFEGRE